MLPKMTSQILRRQRPVHREIIPGLSTQLKWKRRTIAIGITTYYGYKNFRVELDCLGAWTYHPLIDSKCKPAFTDPPTVWRVTHNTSGKVIASARDAHQARKVVEFLASRWPRPIKLAQNRVVLDAMRQALEEARQNGELLFYGVWEEEAALIPYENSDLEKQLISALLA